MTDREKELHFALGHINMCCKFALMTEGVVEGVYRNYFKEIMNTVENLYKKGEDDELNK